jgi:hypothetical protein
MEMDGWDRGSLQMPQLMVDDDEGAELGLL